MKKIIRIRNNHKALWYIVLLFFTISCNKDDIATVPAISTSAISNITQTTATCGGFLTTDGGEIITFRGVCWSTNQNPTIADSKILDETDEESFTCNIAGLTLNTTYFVRAYATSRAGTGYGTVNSFRTQGGQVPVLSTSVVSDITQTAAKCGGNIMSDGGATVTARGLCWSKAQIPTISDSTTTDGTGAESFVGKMTGLTNNSIYYVRAYATNTAGTGYGSTITFTTQQPIMDIDGNAYNTVIIGTQVWMVENLNVTRYRNGDPIPNVTSNGTWSNLTTGAYCNYNNTPLNSDTYGKLYNWYAVVDSRELCPTNWHVASDAEWKTLINYLGDSTVAGGKLKETGTLHWQSPNTGATNESGFTALPGGGRGNSDNFGELKNGGYFWSATEDDFYKAWIHSMIFDSEQEFRGPVNKEYGFPVRCIRDE